MNTTSETTAATCEEAGEITYTATFTNEAFETQTKTVSVEAVGHDWGEVTYTWADDNSTVTAKRVCSRDENHVEEETVNTTATITTDPTCETAGVRTYTAVFTNEAFDAQTKTEEIPALGHAWGEPTYVWAEDNSTVTATVACANDPSHTVTETVNTSYEVTVEPTTESEGTGVYTAVFENELFGTQTKEVTLDKLSIEGHYINVTNYAQGGEVEATTSIEEGKLYSGDITFTVDCGMACLVAVKTGEDSYDVLPCAAVGDTHSFTVTVSDADVEIVVVIKGDFNLDGKVSGRDATQVAQAAVGNAAMNSQLQFLAVNYNGAEELNGRHATRVAQVAVGNQSYEW